MRYKEYILPFLLFAINLGISIKVFFLLLFLVILGIKEKGRLKVDLSFILFFFFSSSYLIMIFLSNYEFFLNQFSIIIFLLLIYLLGLNLKLTEVGVIKMVLFSAILLTLTPTFSLFLDFYKYGFMGSGSRSIPYYYSNEIDISPTVMSGLLLSGLSLLSLIFYGGKLKYKYFLISYAFILFLFLIRLGSRTLFILFILIILFGYIYNFKSKFLNIFLPVLSLLILIYFFSSNTDFLLNYFNDRLEASDTAGASSAGGRSERWINSFNTMFQQPFGWDINLHGYAHNMFLDVARVSGLYSAFLLFIWFIYSLTIFYLNTYLLKNKFLKNILYCNIFIFFIIVFLEPILEGFYYYFSFYLFVISLVKGNLQYSLNGKSL